MKSKTLRKKIRRLETRLQEGPRKLAKLKRKLEAQLAAEAAKARKKSAAEAAARRRPRPAARGPGAPKKVRKKRNLSPERRAQLSAAMKARWAAKRAATATNPQSSATDQGFREAGSIQLSENRNDGL